MTTVLELDQVTVRAWADGAVLRTRSYALLDAGGTAVGSAVQGPGGVGDTAKRAMARSRATMPAQITVHDTAGGIVLSVAKRRSGLLLPKVRIEAALANGAVVAIAHSVGRPAREYEVIDPQGDIVATLRRGPGVLFAIADGAGQAAGTVSLDANTLSAQRAGAAHPHSYTLRYTPAAGMLVRIASLAVVLGFDSIRGV